MIFLSGRLTGGPEQKERKCDKLSMENIGGPCLATVAEVSNHRLRWREADREASKLFTAVFVAENMIS